MIKIIQITSKLKYLGLLGIPMLFSDWMIWKYFWLFWLLGVIEIVFELQVFIQSICQLVAIPYIYVIHRFNLPNKYNYKSKIHYSLPFKGTWTVVNGGVNRDMSHSWSILPQRYAYDFLILDNNGKSYSGDKRQLTNYFCYGKDVLAPADGNVVEVNDKFPDSRTYGDGTADHKVQDIRGNYIIIKHDDNEFSMLAHLLPKSVQVIVGQQVKRGEIIAKCGNSGNTTEPHIHFQVQDRRSFYSSAGLPISFDNISAIEAKNYFKFDRRKAIKENLSNDSSRNTIHRGQSVSNLG